MASLPITLDFRGYWRETHISSIPEVSGVYCVYNCCFNQNDGTVTILKLLYIGESENVNDRITNHERWNDWKKSTSNKEELCFSVGKAPDMDRPRAEAALIYQHKPPLNTDFTDRFPFPDTIIITNGKNLLLRSSFIVKSTV